MQNYPMGRELVQRDENEWWIVETVSPYFCRVSKPFESKEEAIETLRKGGCPEAIVDEFERTHHVSSFMISGGKMTALGMAITEALAKADALCPTGDEAMFSDEDFQEEE